MAANWRHPPVDQEGQVTGVSPSIGRCAEREGESGMLCVVGTRRRCPAIMMTATLNFRTFRDERDEASDTLLLAETLAAYYIK
ncbi:hypothetical protein CGRA01v4_11438 [Colletotrichum graminicola]|nr:hypothetical protein CGRA01v4_11438 [Colletotrichum graminicola]